MSGPAETFNDVTFLFEEAGVDIRHEYWCSATPSPVFRVRTDQGDLRVIGFEVEQAPESEDEYEPPHARPRRITVLLAP